MLDTYLIQYSAPTLASLKTASLFSYKFTSPQALKGEVSTWNEKLAPKGVNIRILRQGESRALIYVYRRAKLQADLNREENLRLLQDFGYKNGDINYALARLRQRLKKTEDFPHEIGLFLGYPLCDVVGFIKNKGKDFKCSGCWKVYGDPEETQALFSQYRRCRDCYLAMYQQGKTILQLTVAA